MLYKAKFGDHPLTAVIKTLHPGLSISGPWCKKRYHSLWHMAVTNIGITHFLFISNQNSGFQKVTIEYNRLLLYLTIENKRKVKQLSVLGPDQSCL